jgi:type IV secretory pathway VirB2 component (pilin)
MILSFKLDSELVWKIVGFLCLSFFILSISDTAMAAAATDPIGDKLCDMVALLQGGTAKAVATVAIIGVAGGLLLGKLNWTVALTVSAGVVVIFSASAIVKMISGGDDGCAAA